MLINKFILIFSECLAQDQAVENDDAPVWVYECNTQTNRCERTALSGRNITDDMSLSLTRCKLKCGNCSRLWPKPTGKCTNSGDLLKFNISNVNLKMTIENNGTLKYLNTILEEYLDFLKAKAGQENLSTQTKGNKWATDTQYKVQINVEIGENF